MAELLIFGAGYSGLAVARAATAAGLAVCVASRKAVDLPPGVRLAAFDDCATEIGRAGALITTAPPAEGGDPVLARWGDEIRASRAQWIAYCSTTGVYGDRGGAWVDEDTAVAPGQDRSRRRLDAELAWRAVAAGRPLDLIRLAGIYGPGRSALDEVRSGRARCILKPGHRFGRIHRDDLAHGVVAAMRRPPDGARVLHFTDDEPAASGDVVAEAARLLGAPPPPQVPFADAYAGMSPMARSFWAENRLVANARTKAALDLAWRYPTYREGLRAILAEERGERPEQ